MTTSDNTSYKVVLHFKERFFAWKDGDLKMRVFAVLE